MIGMLKSALMMGMSLALLWVFYLIVTQGQPVLQEPNVWVLVGEIVGLVAILVFSIYCYVRGIRRRGRRTSDQD